MAKPRLFHGTRNSELAELRGNPDFPQTKKVITENGIEERTGGFVYATHREEQAMLFALPQWPGGSFLITLSDDPESPLILVLANQEKDYSKQEINGVIFGFSGEPFERVVDKNNKPIREWIADGPIPLTGADVTKTSINSLDQILEKKVQVFFLAEGVDPAILKDGGDQCILGDGSRASRLKAITSNPTMFVHANKQKGIGEISLTAKKSFWLRWLLLNPAP